ncbi:unnamed protein product [Trifolium pratense]|uniref:Uncharacterized protein n=1 Tax=Trifolium pratense TaxID=57577 RepID=A0ACB0KX32_TRIPR|nr:unnamed protein product [Trifolium pratense]
MDSQLLDDAVHPTTAATTHHGLPPSGRRHRSHVWMHFTEQVGTQMHAKCNYCPSIIIKFKDGTSSMAAHVLRCKNNPDRVGNKRQKTSPTTEPAEGEVCVAALPHVKFDQVACRLELVKMFVGAELPFRFVENEFFINFVKVLQPRFDIPSRTTLRRAIWSLFDGERERLKQFISKHCGRVCLTTDTWTSVQNLNYMSLTAHFIDKKWNLHKKILNFCQITGHTGKIIVKEVETCLNSWELNQVFSITVDNASSNGVVVRFMKGWMNANNCLILKGNYIHMRCCVHVLSSIVKEGLKENDDSVTRIRATLKYVKGSCERMHNFKKIVERANTTYKGIVCLNVETRWNSTYLMLQAALKYKTTFELLKASDAKYVKELSLNGGKGVPIEGDWNYASTVMTFLKIFYDATMHISASLYVTSNIYMNEVFALGRKIRRYCEDDNESIASMVVNMKSKYDKYWCSSNGVNMILLIAVVLDLRSKLGYVNHYLGYFFEEATTDVLKATLSSSLKSIYREYQRVGEGVGNNA